MQKGTVRIAMSADMAVHMQVPAVEVLGVRNAWIVPELSAEAWLLLG